MSDLLTEKTILDVALDDVADHQGDLIRMSMAADLAEDHGDPILAECLRWRVRNDKWPWRDSRGWTWWFEDSNTMADLGADGLRHILPEKVYSPRGTSGKCHWFYETAIESDRMLYEEWRYAWLDGWRPEN